MWHNTPIYTCLELLTTSTIISFTEVQDSIVVEFLHTWLQYSDLRAIISVLFSS